MFGIIYKAKNKITNDLYIGQTIKGLEKRKKSHIKCERNDCPYFYAAIKKYGVKNFEFTVICRANSMEELNAREIFCIRIFNTIKPHGYNLTSGGRNRSPDQSTRDKISNSLKGKLVGSKNPFFGKTHTKETIELLSFQRKGKPGRPHTKEHKKWMSESQKGKIIKPESIEKMKKTLSLRIHTDETASKRRMVNSNRKPVICHQNGIEYDSIRHAARDLKIRHDHISEVVRGIAKQYLGYIFSHSYKVNKNEL